MSFIGNKLFTEQFPAVCEILREVVFGNALDALLADARNVHVELGIKEVRVSVLRSEKGPESALHSKITKETTLSLLSLILDRAGLEQGTAAFTRAEITSDIEDIVRIELSMHAKETGE